MPTPLPEVPLHDDEAAHSNILADDHMIQLQIQELRIAHARRARYMDNGRVEA
jgi:hypothetical protein